MIPLPFAMPRALARWKRPLIRTLVIAAGVLGYIIAAGAAADVKAKQAKEQREKQFRAIVDTMVR